MKQRNDASIDALAEAAWKVLFGLGSKKREWAIGRVEQALREQGLLTTDDAGADPADSELVTEVIDTAIAFEFLDEPRKGYLRAVIGNAEDYEPEDWEMCVLRAVGKRPVKLLSAITEAAAWAKKCLGLKFGELQTGSFIWERIDQALARCVSKGQISKSGSTVKKVSRAKSLAQAVEAEKGPSETASPEASKKKKRRIVNLIDVERERRLAGPVVAGLSGQSKETRRRRISQKNIERWNVGYRKLLDFVAESGHARVPKLYRDGGGYPLGQWVAEQRKVRDAILAERKTLLESLPGWVWVVYNIKWDERFALLLRFVERQGHARVPEQHTEEGFKLGQWVVDQKFCRDLLTRERQAALEQLPGWIWGRQ